MTGYSRISYRSFYNFSATMFALLVLFLPKGYVLELRSTWDDSPFGCVLGSERLRQLFCRVLRPLLIVIFLAPILARWQWNAAEIRTVRDAVYLPFWTVYGLAAVGLLAASFARIRKLEAEPAAVAFRTVSPWLAIPILLLVFNGLCPYLGLKTENSFSMFSNLRTEGGVSNHLIVRRCLRLSNFQDDLVRVVSSSDRLLQHQGAVGNELTYFSLRTRISDLARVGKRDIQVSYFRNGELDAVFGAELHPELSRPYPYLYRKLLIFRPVQPLDNNRCCH